MSDYLEMFEFCSRFIFLLTIFKIVLPFRVSLKLEFSPKITFNWQDF